MNLMKQIKTSKKDAFAFIEYMEANGYETTNQEGYFSFRKNGILNINYAVSIMGGYFIGVRLSDD